MRQLALLTVIFILSFTSLAVMSQSSALDTKREPGDLSLRLKAVNFIKNNEYFNDITDSEFGIVSQIPPPADKSDWVEGYTLLGFFIQPELVYTASSRIRLRAGVHMLSYSGEDKLSKVIPVFAASLRLGERSILTLGSLTGSDSHRMYDPHFNSERTYNEYTEDGLQLTTKSDHIFSDLWVNWENFVFKGDSVREEFIAGESFRYTSPEIAGFMEIETPLQFQAKHYGGQISNYEEPVETYFSIAGGLKVSFFPAQKKFGTASIEYQHFFTTVVPDNNHPLLTDGRASWLRFQYNYKTIFLGTSYWKAHDFYSPVGNPIYASSVDPDSEYMIPERELLTFTTGISFRPEKYFELYFGLEGYYDLCKKHLDHSLTLHLNFDNIFRIAQVK